MFPRTIWSQWRGLVPDADVVLEIVNGVTFLTPLWLRTPRVTLIHHVHREHYVREMGPKGVLAAFLFETAPLRLLYRRSRFITVSRSSAGDIAGHGIPPEQIELNHNGVEADAFASGERSAEPRLLYLGRIKRYKRIELLLDVLEGVPEATLDIAGDGSTVRHSRLRLNGDTCRDASACMAPSARTPSDNCSSELGCISPPHRPRAGA